MDPAPPAPEGAPAQIHAPDGASVSPDPSYVPAIERLLTQIAHRLLTLAIWLLAARVALGLFDYDPGVTSKFLPFTMIALNAALVCAFAAYWICRLARCDAGESRTLLFPTLCLIALTSAWMAGSILAARQAP